MSVTSAHSFGPEKAAHSDGQQSSLADSLVLALAPGLSTTRSIFRRKPRYVVSDPARASHAAVTPEIWSFLSSLSGTHSLTQVLQRLQISGRPVPALSSLLPVLARLRDIGLIKIVSGALPIPETAKGKQPLEAKLVYYRRELVELMPAMPLANRLLGWMFTREGAALWGALLCFALYQLASQWGRMDNPLMWLGQLSTTQAMMLYGLTLAIKGIHELSHAVAYRRMAAAEGKAVNSIRAGISFMLFMPFPFTNCTGTWAISDKYRRATVGLAGMYAETWIAIIALLFWSVTRDPILSSLCLQIAMIVGLSTLVFNLNPLARLDGYYVFTDLLERPNLQAQAAQAAMISFQRWLKIHPQDKRPAAAEPGLLAYWAATSLYRWGIFAGMIWLALRVSPWLALPVIVVAASLLVYRPLTMHVKMLIAYSEDKAATKSKLLKLAAAAFVMLCVVPLPSGMRTAAVAEMDGAAFVYAPRDARVTAVAASDGSGMLLTLDDPELPLMRAEMQARRSLAAVRYQKALEISSSSPRSVEAARAIAEEINGLDRQLEEMDMEASRLTTTGATADKWDPLQSADLVGSWISRNADRPLGLRAARAQMQVRALVPEQQADSLSRDANVHIRLGENAPFAGRIARIDARATTVLPTVALGKNAGGTIATNPDDMSNRTAQARYVSVWINVPDAAARAMLHHGQILDVRFSGGLRPVAWQLAAAIPQVIRTHNTK